MSAATVNLYDAHVESATGSDSIRVRPRRTPFRLIKGGHSVESAEVVSQPSNSASTLVILSAPGYRFKFPMPVVIERTEDGFIVSDQLVNRYGEGRTPDEAADDYRDVLIDYFETLRQDRGALSPRLARHLAALEVLISRENRKRAVVST